MSFRRHAQSPDRSPVSRRRDPVSFDSQAISGRRPPPSSHPRVLSRPTSTLLFPARSRLSHRPALASHRRPVIARRRPISDPRRPVCDSRRPVSNPRRPFTDSSCAVPTQSWTLSDPPRPVTEIPRALWSCTSSPPRSRRIVRVPPSGARSAAQPLAAGACLPWRYGCGLYRNVWPLPLDARRSSGLRGRCTTKSSVVRKVKSQFSRRPREIAN